MSISGGSIWFREVESVQGTSVGGGSALPWPVMTTTTEEHTRFQTNLKPPAPWSGEAIVDHLHVRMVTFSGYSHADIPAAFRSAADYLEQHRRTFGQIFSVQFDYENGWTLGLIIEEED